MAESPLNGRLRVSWPLLVQVAGWLLAALLAYGAVSTRVAVVETRQGEIDRRLERIENKVDLLVERGR